MRSVIEHTQTPWEYREDGEANHYVIIAAGKWLMTLLNNGSETSFQQKANMAFIVRAANAHDDLVQSLKDLADLCEKYLPTGPGLNEILSRADNALAKARLIPTIVQAASPESGNQ